VTKSVKYVLGGVGLAPALVLTVPATGHGVTTPSRTGHKSVSLVPLNTGCTGTTLAQTSSDPQHTILKFWYTRHSSLDTCIGTVEVSYTVLPTEYIRYRIWEHSAFGKQILGASDTTSEYILPGLKHATFGVHRSFGYSPITVCTARVSSFGSAASVMCKTVR
jgi:hypothetical protein